MDFQTRQWNLQLFADGGDGGASGAAAEGAAAETGSITGDAARQRLRELNVPESRLKNRQYTLPARQKKTAAVPAAEGASQPVTGNETPAEPARMAWKDIVKDPEYSKELSALVGARVKEAKTAQGNLDALRPALEVLSRKYGMDVEHLDYAALAAKVNDDDSFYADMGRENGLPTEVNKMQDQAQRKIQNLQRLNDRFQQRLQEQNSAAERDQMLREHYAGLERQATDLQKLYPNFDLAKELKNETFFRMTSPEQGYSVKQAYTFVHQDEIIASAMQNATQQAQSNASRAIQSGSMRPKENGSSAAAPTSTQFNYAAADPASRAAIREQMRRAAASGQKVTPGMFVK